MTLAEALARRTLLSDGANGTYLSARGFRHQPFDFANLEAPHLVAEVHRLYFHAGADFVETNTYQANRWRLGADAPIAELNRRGAELAREAAGDGQYVMGAIGPSGKTLTPIGTLSASDVTEAVTEQAVALLEGGVDGFFLETFTDLEELELAIHAIRALTDAPIFAAKAFIEDGEALAEGLAVAAARRAADWPIQAFGANCIVGPQRMLDIVRQLSEANGLPVVSLPTPGMPQLVKGQIAYDTDPEYFARAVQRLVEAGARVIGGCCGTTPAHIAAIRQVIKQVEIKRAASAGSKRAAVAPKAMPITPPSPLREKLARGEFVTAVEMDVPRGLNMNKLVAGSQQLRETGVDVINISDGARARLRMNPTAVCSLLLQQGVESTMHFACRDRNLLAIQSDLLGAHALGIRNILAVTGDPANIGDYPSATSVFDIDSIGLCRILQRFNEGIDLAGNRIGHQCGFTICAAYNPCALDQPAEDDRLRRKADAGAMVIYTQPVFDSAAVERCVEAGRQVGLPVLVGLLPLKSARHAEFMHHEVPGIEIPPALLARIQAAASDEDALRMGIEESVQLGHQIRATAAGAYLMPPFGNAEIAAEILRAI